MDRKELIDSTVTSIVDVCKNKDKFELQDAFDVIHKGMLAAKTLSGLPGSEKEDVAYEILEGVLAQTDSWGPDIIVDPLILKVARPMMRWFYKKVGLEEQ